MKKLFEEFKSASHADWKNQIIKDLKGEPYESLVWNHDNGFVIEPFYNSENLSQIYEPVFTHQDWEICVKSKGQNAKEINKNLLLDLNRGANSFTMPVGNNNLVEALDSVGLNYIHSTYEINKENALQLQTYLESNYDLNELNISLFFENFDALKKMDDWLKTINHFLNFSSLKAVSFNAISYHNLNALAFYEVAIIFSGIIEQLECLKEHGKSFTSKIVVKTGVSSDFFTQIAKLRAIRRLWNCFKEEYQISNHLYLIVETSLTNKSLGDKHNNLLRSSVEAMAAVAGGCNELIVNEFDFFNSSKDIAASRLAINQQLILKHESYLDSMADIGCGSYYIETLTDAIASKALNTFKYFESEGGYLNCVEKNIFKTEIAKQALIKQEEINTKKQIVIGVNRFKNEKEVHVLSEQQIEALQRIGIENPVLNYELQNNTSHA
jgi:methylmalonyl-CoA mutase